MSVTQTIPDLTKMPPEDAHRLVADVLGEQGHRPWLEMREKQERIRLAGAKPLPGESADAFLRGSIKVADFAVNEVRPVHHLALQAVNSPLLVIIGDASLQLGQPVKREIEPPDEWAICYIFTTDTTLLFDTWERDKGGFGDFIRRNSAKRFLNENSATITALVNSVFLQYKRHQQTVLEMHSQIESQVEKKTFQELMETLTQPASASS